jgi:GSCFA family protein
MVVNRVSLHIDILRRATQKNLKHPRMKLSTPVELPRPNAQIELGTRFLTLGSCFAERVGQKLKEALFRTTVNPTGIYYNPISLSNCLEAKFRPPTMFLHQGMWRSLQHHSSLSGTEYSKASLRVVEAEQQRIQALNGSQVLLLTLGTAQLWETVGRGVAVANCHRLDGSLFRRRRISVHEATESLLAPLHHWLDKDIARTVILTVSPVRYLRDGLVENSRGKSVLLLCCEELERSHERIVYFPSYEIFCDQLRDYRYYADDLVQPSTLGVKLVWEAFSQTFFSQETRSLLARVEKVQQLANHRLSVNSKPAELARKGLRILDELETVGAVLESVELRALFRRWESRDQPNS